jgi:surface carbohydrate biosynthesis protein
MNIYIHLETSVRELDSKLLLAVVAASKGHEVIISDQESIIKGLERKMLTPGIFHTKSLTPSSSKITKHNKLINAGCKITSIDEEGGLVDYGYKQFVKTRYSQKTIKQASAVFTWGPEDHKILKKIFPNYAKKIHMTGSPRVDLWRPLFYDYWINYYKKQTKPFLLIPSNQGFDVQHINDRIKFLEKAEYLKKDPNFIHQELRRESEQFKIISYFIEAIKKLAYKNKNFNIIVRPHPSENIEIWKILLNKFPNVYVNRDDAASLWIKNAFAILHSGCTTALEASFFKKPIITYAPFKAYYSRKLANDLGQKVTSINDLTKKVNKMYLDSLKNKKQKKFNESLPRILLKKIFVDEKETAAVKIIKVWENINDSTLMKKNNWLLFKFGLKVMKFNGLLGKLFKNESKINKFNKFPPFDKYIVLTKIDKLKKLLKIKQKIDCEFVSDKTILIRRK